MARPRFAAFLRDGRERFGRVTDAGVIDLTDDFPQFARLQDAVVASALPDLAAVMRAPDLDEPTLTYLIPLAAPEKIICVGVNFPDRNAEYKDGQAAPERPSLFIRFARSFTGHRQPLIRPPESPQLDYEGEVTIVIGKTGRRIARAQAYDHIAALTLANEGTIRDWVRHAKFNVTQGKNWDASGSIGPSLVPFDDPAQLDDIRLTTRVNGALRQDDLTSRMIYDFRYIVEYVSTFCTLVPGDMILCGTPTGAGARFDPPRWLVPGDVVEIEAEGIGILSNGVADA